MKTVSIWWNDKRIKHKHFSDDFAKILLDILIKNRADKIDVKFPHYSIDTYTRQELLSIAEQTTGGGAVKLR